MSSIRKIGYESQIDRILNRDFTSTLRRGYIEVGENNCCLPVYYENWEKEIKLFEIRESDVILCGLPKTGTTWLSEMIWLIGNNVDYDTATAQPVYVRFPQMELPCLFDTELTNRTGDIYKLSQAASPRFYKSHLPWSLLPEQICNYVKNPKIINVLRDPKDVCVSYYYHSQTLEGYKGTFKDFCELFLAGRVCFLPFWEHVLSFWNQRHRSNMLLIKYSDMKKDLPGVIRTVAKFLDKSLTDEEVSKLAKHLSFESMKNNPATNYEGPRVVLNILGMAVADNAFLRSGVVGGYKVEMSEEMIKRFEDWRKEHLKGTDLVL